MEIEEDELHLVETIEDENLLKTTLTIDNVTSEDAGTYKVVAQNDAGEETVSASLIVKGRLLVKRFFCAFFYINYILNIFLISFLYFHFFLQSCTVLMFY